ncbi:MAG TPA: hypothetical protein VFN35_08330 [Ktedonobacteraceae bacterium]|nr:hypothetical protein [Ktedonobacteraceae bacterium]
MYNWLQKCLLGLSVIALIFLLVEIAISLAATQHGQTPARVDTITAGPYRFKVSLYNNPARAGFTLPFAIAPQGQTAGRWTYDVTSVPDGTLSANPVRDSVSADPQIPGGIQGVAEITVQGSWNLQVVVVGPAGQQTFAVPVTAVTLPPIPTWLGWLLGFVPVYGITVFLFLQRRKKLL